MITINQRLLGLLLILLGIATVPLCDMDGTAAVVIIPIGMVALFHRD